MSTSKSSRNVTKDRLQTEHRLLKAAEEVFSKHGFKGATTRMIANKANINLSLINRYFEGKYGLFLAVVEQKLTELTHQELDYPPQKNLTDELAKYGERRLMKHYRDLNMIKIVMGQFFSDEKFLKKFRNIMPLIPENKELEKRLKTFNKKEKLTLKYPVSQIISDIETHAFAMCLINIIVKDRPLKEVMMEFKNFISLYSSSLAQS